MVLKAVLSRRYLNQTVYYAPYQATSMLRRAHLTQNDLSSVQMFSLEELQVQNSYGGISVNCFLNIGRDEKPFTTYHKDEKPFSTYCRENALSGIDSYSKSHCKSIQIRKEHLGYLPGS